MYLTKQHKNHLPILLLTCPRQDDDCANSICVIYLLPLSTNIQTIFFHFAIIASCLMGFVSVFLFVYECN